MANNTGKNRIPVKWIRDGAKSAYDKKDFCFICDATEELELHHTHGMTNLLMGWASRNKISLDTDEQVLEIRDRFISEHHKEVYEDVYTLCVKHHLKLHSIYGKSPALSSASRQGLWIQKQKDKINGTEQSNTVDSKYSTETKPSTSTHSKPGGFSRWY